MKKRNYLLLFVGSICFTLACLAQDPKEGDRKGREAGEKREFLERHQDELKGLSPEERQAKIRELRKVEGAKRSNNKGMSPEERQAKRKEMQERLQKQLTDLRKKQAEGTLNEQEKKRLQRMEEIARRFEQDQTRGQGGTTNQVGKGEKRLKEK